VAISELELCTVELLIEDALGLHFRSMVIQLQCDEATKDLINLSFLISGLPYQLCKYMDVHTYKILTIERCIFLLEHLILLIIIVICTHTLFLFCTQVGLKQQYADKLRG